MTLVNKIIEVSGVQFCKSLGYCIVCSLPQGESPSVTICPLYLLIPPPPPSPLVSVTLLSVSMSCWGVFFVLLFSFCLITSPFLPCPPTTTLPSDSCQSALCESVSVLLVSLFCSLDSTYEWDHMILVFLWPAYETALWSTQWSIFWEYIWTTPKH